MPEGDSAPPSKSGLVVCPECRVPMPAQVVETHLRHAHGINQFRNIRYSSREGLVRALRNAVLAQAPDRAAWQQLQALALEEHGTAATAFLARQLRQGLKRVPEKARARLLRRLGPVLGEGVAQPLIQSLASAADPVSRHLALVLLAHAPLPLAGGLLEALRVLLEDRKLPGSAQVAALAHVLPSLDQQAPVVGELLGALIQERPTARSLERLRHLEQRAGQSPALTALCAQLQPRLRMTCPRCQFESTQAEMIHHLWEAHGLVLDGRRVREPWAVVEDWAEQASSEKGHARSEMLRRCRVAGQRLDPENGALRVQRLLREHQLIDPHLQLQLLQEARSEHATRCPRCYAVVPLPHRVPILPVNWRAGRLSAQGYEVEIKERGFRPYLTVRTPREVLYRGVEPGRRWTGPGRAWLLAFPWVLLACVWAFLPFQGAWLLGPVLGLLANACLVALVTRIRWRARVPARDRVLQYAWEILVPGLDFDQQDSAFLAGLASLDDGGRYRSLRADQLPRLRQQADRAVRSGACSPSQRAALVRREIEDAHAAGKDPVPLVAQEVARCFEGKLSLLCAEELLDGWESEWWTPGNLARARVLICDRAFEAGFEVRNLLDAGHTSPSLRAVLRCDDPRALAGLRLLWSQRPTRPWDACGAVETVYSLASAPARAGLLAAYPDLLLWQREEDWPVAVVGAEDPPSSAEFLLAPEGVLFQGVSFTAYPRVIEVRERSRGYELRLGRERFRTPLDGDALMRRVEWWFLFAFRDFLPALGKVETWQSPNRATLLRAWGITPCPDCQRFLLPRVGEVGLPLEEAKDRVQDRGA